MTIGTYIALGLLLIAVTSGAFMAGILAIAVLSSLNRRRKARNAGILARRTEHAARTKGFVALDDPTPDDLMPLDEGDRALIELGFEPTYRPGDRILLASGRIVTGWELAQLAPDLVTVEQSGDVDNFMAEELARCPKFREAYTALAPDETLMTLAEQVDVDPKPTYGQELTYDADGLVQYGTAMVHTRCRDARRDAATDHICGPCGQVFGRVAA